MNFKSLNFYLKANLVFIFVFLNLWDFAINRIIFNGMITGIFMFGLITFLWLFTSIRAASLITLISILEFGVMLVFVGEGLVLGGTTFSLKSAFFLPFLVWSGVNTYWGLKKYYLFKEKKDPKF